MGLFFQAEDGIRDLIVTGVQTCALPIFPHRIQFHCFRWVVRVLSQHHKPVVSQLNDIAVRSEERRVGKECRYRGLSTY